MNEMLVMVPSRNRPQNIERLCLALGATGAEVDLLVGVDDDDPTLADYERLAEVYNFALRIGPRKRFGPMLNELGMPRVDDYEYFMFCGDDHVPVTDHWDVDYRSALYEMQIGAVYGDDLFQGEAIATECAFTTNIPKTLGYVVPEGFIHLYIDNYFMELARSIGKLKYLPDTIVEHVHYQAGKAQEDQTYREANSQENWTNDKIRFDNYVKSELPLDRKKLLAL